MDGFGVLVTSAISVVFALAFFFVIEGRLHDPPKIPPYHEAVSMHCSAVRLITNPNGETFYLFFENNKEVKIKKQ